MELNVILAVYNTKKLGETLRIGLQFWGRYISTCPHLTYFTNISSNPLPYLRLPKANSNHCVQSGHMLKSAYR